ncbi:hypothetical protein NPIL_526221 [Nephila pilipes]|uniref:Uncharacterized protein n=1 Tax=Nephila pilipes TaxID=299642 RepID=A0A8X6Q226_NEPPI|nr:hypothetical protein NPIL_526221 [Nephila pilipes]
MEKVFKIRTLKRDDLSGLDGKDKPLHRHKGRNIPIVIVLSVNRSSNQSNERTDLDSAGDKIHRNIKSAGKLNVSANNLR